MVTGATVVYLLCLLASAVCAWLLVRSYLRTRTRLLLWSAACFVLLAINNLFVVIDTIIILSIDFTPVRTAAALAGISVLLYGFITELE